MHLASVQGTQGTLLLRGSNVLLFATLVNACRVGVFVLNLRIGRSKFPAGNSESFFFFKQKTAYEISLGLVGSEMCIRDR